MVRDSKVAPAAHQPSKAELEEDVSIDATPEAAGVGRHARGGAAQRARDRQREWLRVFRWHFGKVVPILRLARSGTGTVLDVVESIEPMIRLKLEDGTLVRLKISVIEVMRMDEPGKDGKPTYNLNAANECGPLCLQRISWMIDISTALPASFSQGFLEGKIADTIRSFANLPAGWHYGTGTGAVHAAVDAALNVNSLLVDYGARNIEVFPDVDGGILVSGYRDRHTLEILCCPDGRMDLVYEVGDEICE